MQVSFSDGSSDAYEDTSFARGAEGELFRSLDHSNAVKLYYTSSADPNRADRLRFLMLQRGHFLSDPMRAPLFAWPSEIAVSPRPGVRSRYVADAVRMDHYLFEESYHDLPRSKRGTWLGRIAAAIKLARAIACLDPIGMCHGDICPRNIMVDLVRGDAALLDCDGIVARGAPPTGILGSREYLAPELVTGVAGHPSLLTDRHSLAVTLYTWLLYRHPLFGPKRHDLDPDLDDQLALGARALYIENPTDHSNRPSNLLISSETLTPQMRTLFQHAFVEGLREPEKRPTAAEWEGALVELFDNTIPCPNPSCEQQYFAAVHPTNYHCPLCGTPLLFPEALPSLTFEEIGKDRLAQTRQSRGGTGWTVVGWPGRALYSWHFERSISTPGPDSSSAAHAAIDYDMASRVWYLRNETLTGLNASLGGGSEWLPVLTGSSTQLRDGMRLCVMADETRSHGGTAIVEMCPTVPA